jgi:hypothetical protein
MTEPAPSPLHVDVALLRRRMGHWHPAVPVVLLWSEKAGCTSLLRWFLGQTGDLEEAERYSDWIHDWEFDVMKARDGYDRELARRLEAGTPVFKLVREPFARAVSQYLMMLTLSDESGHFTVPIRRQVREFVHGTADTVETFSFIEYLTWLSGQDLEPLNDHVTPQYTPLERVLANAGRSVELLRLESFADDISRLEHHLGLPAVDTGEASRSSHHTVRHPVEADPEAVVRLRPPVPLPPDYPIPQSASFMTPETTELVARIFADDFDVYGYETPVAPWRSSRSSGRVELCEAPRALDPWMRSVVNRLPISAEAAASGGDDRAVALVVLRDPVTLAWAEWQDVVASTDHPLHDVVVDRGLRLGDVVGLAGAWMLDNMQVRALGGGPIENRLVTEADLQNAELRLLDPASAIGIAEHPEATAAMFGARYGRWLLHRTRTGVTASPQNSDLDSSPDADDLEALEALTRYDRRLYATAVRTFHERWALLPPHVRIRRRTLPFENRIATGWADLASLVSKRVGHSSASRSA